LNRLWHHLFGAGIVPTVDNFGTRGERPSHPELLDYLAARLVENGWSTKKMIREIVLSRTYSQASGPNPAAETVDPDNRLLWRMSPRRLEAEAIRDTLLQVSGRLDRTRGGPTLPVNEKNLYINQPSFLEDQAALDDAVFYRRAVYLPIMRGSQFESLDILALFDFADPDQVVAVRPSTTVPLQTLYLMNARFMRQESRRLAERLIGDTSLDDTGRVTRLHRLALSRPATADEVAEAQEFVSSFEARLTAPEQSPQDRKLEAWARYCHSVLASTEFLYRR
jgi:hypothetical protein